MDAVLERATEVFWRFGYEGASISALTKAMGVTSPSIYSAFGSKRGLFDAVLERYSARRSAFKQWALSGPTARDVAERLLTGAADWLVDPGEPLGCLSVQGGISAGLDNLDVPAQLAELRGRLETALRDRFECARVEGDLDATVDPAALARYVHAVFLGMSLQAAAGSSRIELLDVAHRALATWPA